MISPYEVSALFENLQTNNQDTFFNQVSENVRWTVMGTHPLAGEYRSKQEIQGIFKRLNKILKEGVVLQVKHVYLDGGTAIVEMKCLSTALNGEPFNNTYCWIVEFDENKVIIRVRAYLDSALVQKLIDENE